jgi:hypothetical protein
MTLLKSKGRERDRCHCSCSVRSSCQPVIAPAAMRTKCCVSQPCCQVHMLHAKFKAVAGWNGQLVVWFEWPVLKLGLVSWWAPAVFRDAVRQGWLIRISLRPMHPFFCGPCFTNISCTVFSAHVWSRQLRAQETWVQCTTETMALLHLLDAPQKQWRCCTCWMPSQLVSTVGWYQTQAAAVAAACDRRKQAGSLIPSPVARLPSAPTYLRP